MGAKSGCGVAELEHVPKSDGYISILPYSGDLIPAIPPAGPRNEPEILDPFLMWGLRDELSP